VRVQHAGIKRRDEQVEVGKHDSHGAVDDTVVAVHKALWLVGVASTVAGSGQWRVSQVELLRPANPFRCSSGGGGHIGVVGTNSLIWCIPLEEDLLAWERERLRLVVGN